MRAVIERVVTSDADGTIVEFASDVGRGAAVWAGGSSPRLATTMDFEIDVDVVLADGVNCHSAAPSSAAIVFDGVTVRFTCLVESVDPDRVVVLRFAVNWLSMAESDGSVRAGDWIRCVLPARALRITPIGG